LAGVLAAGLLTRDVLILWVGPEYAFLAPYAFVLFASTSFMLSTSTAHHMLKGIGRLRAVVLIYVTALVIVPIASILVVLQVSRNPYVATTSGLAAGHLVCGCLQVAIGSKTMGAGLRELSWRAYAQPAIVAAVVYGAVFGLAIYGGVDGLVGRVGLSVLAVFLFFGGCYALIATRAERQQVKEVIHLVTSKVSWDRRTPEE